MICMARPISGGSPASVHELPHRGGTPRVHNKGHVVQQVIEGSYDMLDDAHCALKAADT